MRKIGCALAVMGLLLCVAAFVLFGSWLLHTSQERRVGSLTLAPGGGTTGPLWSVDPERRCRLTVGMRVKTPSVRSGSGLIPEYKPQYRFPFSYRVADAEGRTVHAEESALMSVWGPRPTSTHNTGTFGWRVFEEDVGPRGGTLRVEHQFQAFEPLSAQIRVEVEMGRDARFKAEALNVELALYDGARSDAPVFFAIGSALAGMVVLFVGLVLAAPRSARRQDTEHV